MITKKSVSKSDGHRSVIDMGVERNVTNMVIRTAFRKYYPEILDRLDSINTAAIESNTYSYLDIICELDPKFKYELVEKVLPRCFEYDPKWTSRTEWIERVRSRLNWKVEPINKRRNKK